MNLLIRTASSFIVGMILAVLLFLWIDEVLLRCPAPAINIEFPRSPVQVTT